METEAALKPPPSRPRSYDFIGRQETLRADAERLLSALKLEKDVAFPASPENATALRHLPRWFEPVPPRDRRRLYEIYEPDFKLFGYPKPQELFRD